ncbi:MAG: ABC transporter permease [Thermotogota bacterium]
MVTYIVRRLLWLLFVVFGVMTLVFFISRVIPADPVAAMLGGHAPADLVEEMRAKWGLDKPVIEQYLAYVWQLLHGDFGVSMASGRHVLQDLVEYFPATLELATVGALISVVGGIVLGVVSAVRRGKLADHVARVAALTGISMPVFWLALLMMLLFYFILGWLPGGGRLPYYMDPPTRITGMILIDSLIARRLDMFTIALKHFVMPALTLSFFGVAAISRVTRASMLDVLGEDYVRTARSKGLVENRVVLRHALKNAMLPVVTIAGIVYGRLLEGGVIVETIFAWPGLGRYATNAFLALDFPAVVGSTMVIALFYSLMNLVVDILYAFLDPRVRYD